MAESGHMSEVLLTGKDDPRVVALHHAASRAEEAAERLQSYTIAAQPLLQSLAFQTALRVPWTAPLTPDDSAEESLDNLGPENTHKHPSPILAARGTPVARPATLASSSNTASGKKRGRPRKLNLIDSIVGQGQPRSIAPANPKPKGRPPGTGKFRSRDQRPSSSDPRPLQPSPANAEGTRIFVASRVIDRIGKDVSSQADTQFMSHDISGSFQKNPVSSIKPQGSISSALVSNVSPPLWYDSRVKTEEENNTLKVIFSSEIAPIMHSAMTGFEDRLSRDVLVSVGRAVSYSFFVIATATDLLTSGSLRTRYSTKDSGKLCRMVCKL